MEKSHPTTGRYYTLRRVPKGVDAALRAAARRAGKSLNQTAIEALGRGLGLADKPVLHHDLDGLIDSWVDDPAFDEAVACFDRVDAELWR